MKKRYLLLLSTILAVGLVGCGSTFKTEESAVYVKKDGTILGASIESFDEEVYDTKDFEEFVKKEVQKYNENVGKTRVKVSKSEVKDGKASLFLKYESDEDYEEFTGETFFAGTVAEALAEGYTLDMEFYKVEKGKIGETVLFSDIEDSDLKIVIMEEKIGLCVKGKIQFVSKNVELVDKDTITPGKDKEGNVDVAGLGDYIVVIYK